MRVVKTLEELRAARARLPEPVGLVPTMGYLHQGHLSLVEMSKQRCASTVVTIFVNPTQFNDAADLEAYPTDLDADLAKLSDADLVWTPTPKVIYPPGYQTFVEVTQVTGPLEGGRRPGHFRGVATVVSKLFIAAWPQVAFFGAKDAQQVVVIQQLTRDLGFPIEIVVGPTVRASDGLALSSRNARLAAQDRPLAASLYSALNSIAEAFQAGCNSSQQLGELARQRLPEAVNLEYLAFSHPRTLEDVSIVEKGTLVSLAAEVGKVRLIDNITL